MGFAMVAVPVLALLDPSLAPVPQLLVALPMALVMAWRERHHVELAGIGWVIAGRVPGAVLGVMLLAIVTQRTLDLVIAAAVLVAVVIIATGVHIRRSPPSEFGAGLLSGVSGLVASIGGPPLALLYTRDEGAVVRSNLAAIFSIGMTITIAARVLSGNISWGDVQIGLILLPAVLVGYMVSLRFKDRVSQSFVRGSILLIATLGAVGLVIRALT